MHYIAGVVANSTVDVSEPLLAAERVVKRYRTAADDVVALNDVSISVYSGEFVAIMGPSGSGKTTLLNCLSLLDDIDDGALRIAGKNVRKMRDAKRTSFRGEQMGFIFQAFNLVPVFTAAENAELPLLLNGVSPAKARAAAVATLERVGLGHRVHHRPTELSGGEQQRVAIARALAGRPRIVWADEPTGNLDSETADRVLQLLRELHADGMTVMLVTHDSHVAEAAGRIVRMRDGKIIDYGSAGE